jgi:chemotaxis protein MotB
MSDDDSKDDTIDGSKLIKHGRDAPAWMVTYADLMSLLFALFVLLLSFSEVNDNSFKKNAGPMREAFNQNSDFQTDEQSYMSGGRGILSGVRSVQMDIPETEAIREAMVAQLRRSLQADIASNLVELEETTNGIIVRFPSETAFHSGGAELAASSYGTLDKIIPVLARTPGDIKVGGHTDDIPISTLQYRSNWDLSAARATSVVHYFLRSGQIAKKRLTSQGYADSRPLIENKTAQARAKNRRVEISIEVPEDTKDAQKILEKMQPRRRVWSVEQGQKQLLPGVEETDLEQRRREVEEKAKREREREDELNRIQLNSIGRE